MGTLTLADFRDELRLICGGISATSPVWTTARLDRRINASYLWVSMPNHYRHPELENITLITLTANDASYAWPTVDHYMILGVTHAEAVGLAINDETRRTKLDPMDHRDMLTINRPAGKPQFYSYWDETIYIDCVPATAYQLQSLEVHGYRQPTTLSATTDTTVLKPEWDEVILLGAEWRMWVTLNEADRAYEAKQNYGQMVNEIADFRRLHANEWGWQTGAGVNTYMRNG